MKTNSLLSYLCIIFVLVFNEFTLSFFDFFYQIKGTLRILALRLIDILILGLGVLSLLKYKQVTYFKILSKFAIQNIFPIIFALVICDLFLSVLGLGYQSMDNMLSKRYSSPGDSFAGKPNVFDHNEFGFRGKFLKEKDSYNIALFGGSSGYNGKPPIIEIVSNNISDYGYKTAFYNFSSVSSNHTQHTHRLLKFSNDYNFDVVIFYGGGASSILQYAHMDPRPGYPPNYFYTDELHPAIQVLLKYSSIASTIDNYTQGAISGYKKLHLLRDSNWSNKVIENYWEDLNIANKLTINLVSPNQCSTPIFISIAPPLSPRKKELKELYESWKRSFVDKNINWLHLDLTSFDQKVKFKKKNDYVHIDQSSRKLLANHISKYVIRELNGKC